MNDIIRTNYPNKTFLWQSESFIEFLIWLDHGIYKFDSFQNIQEKRKKKIIFFILLTKISLERIVWLRHFWQESEIIMKF